MVTTLCSRHRMWKSSNVVAHVVEPQQLFSLGVGIDLQFPQIHLKLELSSGGPRRLAAGGCRRDSAKKMPPRVPNKRQQSLWRSVTFSPST